MTTQEETLESNLIKQRPIVAATTIWAHKLTII